MEAKSLDAGFDTDTLAELMELLKGAKSVELKLTIPAEHHRATILALRPTRLSTILTNVRHFLIDGEWTVTASRRPRRSAHWSSSPRVSRWAKRARPGDECSRIPLVTL